MRKIITNSLLLFTLATNLAAQQSAAPVATLSNLTRVEGRQIVKDEDLKSKEISKELAVPKNGDIYIDNSSRGIVVKTWDQQKVKVATTVYYDGDSKLTDEEWLEKVNLSLKVLGSSVKIKSGNVSGNGNGFYSYNTPSANSLYYSYSGSGTAVFNANGENIGTKNNVKRIVTVTIPAGSKLDIESKYADITLPANIGDLNVDISNGSLETDNLGKLSLRSKYSTVNIGDAKSAEVELINGRFNAKNIDDLDIDSKNSTVELGNTKKTEIRSANDEYEFEEVGEIHGRKNYGNLRITKLNNSIDLEGANSDIKIRNIAATVSLIKIDNKYADIRIPLKNTKNYSIDYSGAYSAVYGNFEKKALALTDKEQQVSILTGTLRSATSDERGTLRSVTGEMRPGQATTITSLGKLTEITVTRFPTDPVMRPSVATAGSLNTTTLTVTGTIKASTLSAVGNVTPAYGYVSGNNSISAVTVPGYYVGSQGGISGGYTPAITTTDGLVRGTLTYGRGFSSAISNNDTPAKFTATVGDGKALKIDVKCLNCTVDFK